MNLLLLAFGFQVQYRVVRCAAAAGMKVFVLGTPEAAVLRTSRYCSRFLAAPNCNADNKGLYLERWRQRIEECAANHEIGLVVAGDTQATSILALLSSRLSVPTYPVPSHASFELLHDKWTFYKLCNELGFRTPQSWLFQNKAALAAALRASELPEHLIAKPTRQSGSAGVLPFHKREAGKYLARIDYEPILLQEYISGQTTCLSIFVEKGETRIVVGYFRRRQQLTFATNDTFLSYASGIGAHLRTDGLLNFDAQITDEGDVYLLECNPRMYLNLDFAALAGLNFISEGLRVWGNENEPLRVADQQIRTLWGFCKTLVTPWRMQGGDMRMAAYRLADPVPLVVEIARLLLARVSCL
jgi:predicted ATP-grasp superfamily ATP-dependent carboligase